MDIKLKKISDIDGESKKVNHNSETFNIFSKVKLFTMKWESYFQVYDKIFKKYKDQKVTFVEVGVSGGGSLFIWREYFGKQARIIGIDFNPAAKKLEKYGFEIFIGNQSDKNFWKEFYRKIGKIDILFDDGGHKNIQQITSFMESYNNINQNGIIVVEDTHTSYMKKKGFKNPSNYSFINFCNLIIENLHRRNPSANKSLNILSKKIDSIYFYDSIVSINFGQFKKLNQTRLLENNKKLRNYFIDFRHKGNFIKTINKFEKSFGKIDESSITYKLIRKLFHRNPLITMKEKIRIKKYQKILKL